MLREYQSAPAEMECDHCANVDMKSGTIANITAFDIHLTTQNEISAIFDSV